jgi:peptidoglycan hydrolase-like protein with peptidoglycan-binding domain
MSKYTKMMKRFITAIFYTVIFFSILISIGYILDLIPTDGDMGKDAQPRRIYLVKEQQEHLISLGYNIKADGIWGPETDRANEEAWTEQEFGNESFGE